MTRSLFFPILIFVLTMFALVTGCGGSGSTVSGTVTFNGQAVEQGHINFYPADGKGTPVGGEIKAGKYTVRNVSPGKNRVEVTSVTKGAAAESMDAGIQAAKNAKADTDSVAPKDEGNGQVHEIGTGSSELNLTLKTLLTSEGKSK